MTSTNKIVLHGNVFHVLAGTNRAFAI